jgi:hypothetical protein
MGVEAGRFCEFGFDQRLQILLRISSDPTSTCITYAMVYSEGRSATNGWPSRAPGILTPRLII